MDEPSSKAKHCTQPPVAGMMRVFMSPGMAPQPFIKWSTSGHAWSVFDIPPEFYQELIQVNEAYRLAQVQLKEYVDNAKKFCNCGSDHADLPVEYD